MIDIRSDHLSQQGLSIYCILCFRPFNDAPKPIDNFNTGQIFAFLFPLAFTLQAWTPEQQGMQTRRPRAMIVAALHQCRDLLQTIALTSPAHHQHVRTVLASMYDSH
jgi:hypothetical protein